VTWVTTEAFLLHFGLAKLTDLPGIDELRAAGLVGPRPVATLTDNLAVIGGRLPDAPTGDAEDTEEREAAEEAAETEMAEMAEMAKEAADDSDGG
jgi:segregation and condensation protein B